MPVTGVAFRLLDGGQAAAREDDLLALHDEVYGQPDDAAFARQFRLWRRQPGFVLTEARHGGYLVGYAAGMPLRPSTAWWKDLATPLPDAVTAEHPGRTAQAPANVRGAVRTALAGGPGGQRPARDASTRPANTRMPVTLAQAGELVSRLRAS